MRKFFDHQCTSNENGSCGKCRETGLSLAPSIRSNLDRYLTIQSFYSERERLSKVAHNLALDATGMGLETVAKPLLALVQPLATAPSATALAGLSTRLNRYRAEITRTAEGRERRLV